MFRDDEAIWLLGMLEALLERLRVRVRYERMPDLDELCLKSGLCRLRGSWVVIVDKQLSPGKKCEVFLDVLKQLDTSDVFIPPYLRQLIDRS